MPTMRPPISAQRKRKKTGSAVTETTTSTLLRLILLASACLACLGHGDHGSHDDHVIIGCATHGLAPDGLFEDSERRKSLLPRVQPRFQDPLCVGCIEIDLIFHPIEDSGRQSDVSKIVTDAAIDNQIRIINLQYADTPFRFRLRETVWHTNDNWAFSTLRFTPDGPAGEISAALRRGGADVANIFMTDGTCINGNFASIASFKGIFPDDKYSKADYVFLCPHSLATTFDPGFFYFLTHEVGHWLGLYHPFEGGCDPSDPNDFVSDTPQMVSSSEFDISVCDGGRRDSCPGLPGDDPIFNYMGYTSCASEFTPGQVRRMYQEFNLWRRQIDPCDESQSSIKLEFRFDNNPEQTFITYSDWGAASFRRFSLMPDARETHVDYANQLITHEFCIPRDTVFELQIEDSASNGLQSPGYYSWSMNGRELVRGSDFNSRQLSIFVAGDSNECPSNKKRFQLEIEFDDFASTITWDLRTSDTDRLVLDSSGSYVSGANEYFGNFNRNRLFVDHCLDDGAYTFTIRDSFERLSPGYYRISLDGQELRQGGGANGFLGSEELGIIVAAPIPGFGICFSGSSVVNVQGRGPIELNAVEIGDFVEVAKDEYEQVYSFGHYAPETMGNFLELTTRSTKLQVSKDHMVFVDSGEAPLPAALVRGGDVLVGGGAVVAILNVTRVGVFAPFTPSGKIVVNGVLSSCFVAFTDSATLEIAGIDMSFHWMAHAFEFPHRLVCHYLGSCKNERYSRDGISTWVKQAFMLIDRWWDTPSFKSVLAVVALLVLPTFVVLEFILTNPIWLTILIIPTALISTRSSKRKQC